MFSTILENAVTQEEIKQKKKIEGNLEIAEQMFRNLGELWEKQVGGFSVYSIYRQPDGNLNLIFGDVRFSTSFKTIMRTCIDDGEVYAYVSDQDLIEIKQREESLSGIETADTEESIGASLVKMANTSIGNPLKDVINIVRKSTEKSIEEEQAEKLRKNKEAEKSVAETPPVNKSSNDGVTTTNTQELLSATYGGIFSDKRVRIHQAAILEDLDVLINHEYNIKAITFIGKYLKEICEEVPIFAKRGIDFGFFKIPANIALNIYKAINNQSVQNDLYFLDERYFDIGNVRFHGKKKENTMVFKRSLICSKNSFR